MVRYRSKILKSNHIFKCKQKVFKKYNNVQKKINQILEIGISLQIY